jgi:hypothetical protein
MKRIVPALIIVLASAFAAFGQSTTVSGTTTDAGSQAWANGTYKLTFTPNPQFPVGPYTWTGGTLNRVISGSLDGSGHYSVSVPSNSAITPAGSTWVLQVTPNATSPSFTTAATTITGGTQTLNATPPAILISWSLPPGPAISAYADGEIGGTLVPGSEYFNTTSLLTRVWNGSAWANQGAGGGGGACPTTDANTIQKSNGTSCADAAATDDGTTFLISDFLNASGGLQTPVTSYDTCASTYLIATGTLCTTATGAYMGDVIGFSPVVFAAFDAHSSLPTLSNNDCVGIHNATSGSSNVLTDVGLPCGVANITQRTVTTSPDTVLSTDQGNRIVFNSASAVAESLPTNGSTGFANGFNTRFSNQNAGTVTVTPASGTINGNATLVILEGQDCFLTPSSTGTNWAADCNEPQMTAGTGISITRAVHGITLASTGVGTVTGTANQIDSTGGTTPVISLDSAIIFPGTTAYSTNGTASTAPLLVNASLFTGGSGTTTFPYQLFQPTGTAAVTTWSTAGTAQGYNFVSGYTGNVFDVHIAGGGSTAFLSATGGLTLSGGATLGGSSALIFNGNAKILSNGTGNILLESNGSGAISRLVLGNDSASNPAICVSGTGIKVGQGAANCTTLTAVQAGSYSLAALVESNTAPTIAAAGCGGSAASISANNGTAAFNINTGTAPASTGCTVTMPAATTGWNCYVNDMTSNSTLIFVQKQTGAISTTSVVLQNFSDVAAATAPNANDIYHVACSAY